MKKIISLALALVLVFALAVPAMAAGGTVTELTASYTSGTVTFSGKTSDVKAAVAVQVVKSSNNIINILGMSSAVISSTGAFEGEIAGLTLSAGTYTVRAADYDGGPWETFDLVVTAPPIVIPPVEDVKTDAVTATVSGGKATVTAVDTSKVESGEAVSLDFSNSKTDVKEVQLPTETLKAISEATSGGLEIKLSTGTVAFDAAAMDAISEAAEGKEISLNVETVDKKELSAEQKSTVEGLGNALIIKATLTSDGEPVSDFGGGSAAVTVEYEKKGANKTVVVYYLDDAGKLTKMNSAYDAATKTISFTAPHFSEYVVTELDTLPFDDLETGAWYHDGIHYCLEKGLMNGVGGGKFDPTGSTTRGMMMTMMARAAGVDTTGGETWYSKGLAWAVENGVSDGTNPTATITREQMATMIYKFVKANGGGFKGSWMFLLDYVDRADVSEWADEAMHWCVMKGIITGKDGNRLDPQGKLSRAEAAAMMQRFLQLDEK